MQLRYIGRAVAFFDPSSRRVVPLPATCVGVVVLCSCGYDFDAPFALSAWADASGEAGGGLSDAPLGDGAGAAGGSEMGGSAGAAAGGTGGAATGGTGGAATGGTGGTATGGFGAGGQDACVPATCASLGAGCGQVDDGCGATLDCGMCPADQPCVDDGTMTYCCTPLTCSGLQAQCGDWPDGCGSLVSCGSCTPPGKCIQDTSGATCRIACSPGDPLVDSCVAAQDWACRGDCDSLIGDTTVTSLAESADFCIAQNATCCAYGDPTCSECSGGGNCGAFHTFDTSPHETADSYILCLD